MGCSGVGVLVLTGATTELVGGLLSSTPELLAGFSVGVDPLPLPLSLSTTARVSLASDACDDVDEADGDEEEVEGEDEELLPLAEAVVLCSPLSLPLPSPLVL